MKLHYSLFDEAKINSVVRVRKYILVNRHFFPVNYSFRLMNAKKLKRKSSDLIKAKPDCYHLHVLQFIMSESVARNNHLPINVVLLPCQHPTVKAKFYTFVVL
jgi:hypothetical protein